MKALKVKNNSNWIRVNLQSEEKDFQEKSELLISIINVGGGTKNIHMGGTLRDLNFLYLKIMALRNALSISEGKY